MNVFPWPRNLHHAEPATINAWLDLLASFGLPPCYTAWAGTGKVLDDLKVILGELKKRDGARLMLLTAPDSSTDHKEAVGLDAAGKPIMQSKPWLAAKQDYIWMTVTGPAVSAAIEDARTTQPSLGLVLCADMECYRTDAPTAWGYNDAMIAARQATLEAMYYRTLANLWDVYWYGQNWAVPTVSKQGVVQTTHDFTRLPHDKTRASNHVNHYWPLKSVAQCLLLSQRSGTYYRGIVTHWCGVFHDWTADKDALVKTAGSAVQSWWGEFYQYTGIVEDLLIYGSTDPLAQTDADRKLGDMLYTADLRALLAGLTRKAV